MLHRIGCLSPVVVAAQFCALRPSVPICQCQQPPPQHFSAAQTHRLQTPGRRCTDISPRDHKTMAGVKAVIRRCRRPLKPRPASSGKHYGAARLEHDGLCEGI